MAKDEKEDLQFNRDELLSDDVTEAAIAREKRNSPMPEKYREDQTGLGDWPVHEGRKPAAMPADTVESLQYKIDTIEAVDEDKRRLEADGATGDAARVEFNRLVREAGPGADMNEIQAPPSRSAQLAADGQGAQSSPVPIVDPANPTRLATPSLANPTLTASKPAAAKPSGDNKK